MNYKVIERKGKYEVYEKNTSQSVATGNRKDVSSYCRFLNFGGAFDGWTPSFIVKNIFIIPPEKAYLDDK
jgi:hypothetical protein